MENIVYELFSFFTVAYVMSPSWHRVHMTNTVESRKRKINKSQWLFIRKHTVKNVIFIHGNIEVGRKEFTCAWNSQELQK